MEVGHSESFGVSVAGPVADITEARHVSIIPNYPSWRNRPARWIHAARQINQIRPCYTAVAAAGKKADRVAARLVMEAVETLWPRPSG